MYKFVLLVLISLSPLLIIAQETEEVGGGIFIGGSFSFLSQDNTYPISVLTSVPVIPGTVFTSSSNEIKNISFSFRPYVGKKISEKISGGVQLRYSLNNWKDEEATIGIFPETETGTYERNRNELGIFAFGRFDLTEGSKFVPFLQPYLGYSLSNEEQKQNDELVLEQDANYFEVGSSLGALYKLSDRFNLRVSMGLLNYISGKWETNASTESTSFSSFGTSLNLGSFSLGVEIQL